MKIQFSILVQLNSDHFNGLSVQVPQNNLKQKTNNTVAGEAKAMKQK